MDIIRRNQFEIRSLFHIGDHNSHLSVFSNKKRILQPLYVVKGFLRVDWNKLPHNMVVIRAKIEFHFSFSQAFNRNLRIQTKSIAGRNYDPKLLLLVSAAHR